jgi:DegV family protein with EDD domain
MNKVALVSDSSAYIPQEYVERYNLTIVPLTVNWKGESYYDGIDIQATEFYQQLAESKELATTSQVTVGQFLETFKKLLDEGKDVLYMGMSKGLSATMDSAAQAKRELGDPENLIIMDSRLVSMAMTLMVLEVARAMEKGATRMNVTKWLRMLIRVLGCTLQLTHWNTCIVVAALILPSVCSVLPWT